MKAVPDVSGLIARLKLLETDVTDPASIAATIARGAWLPIYGTA